MAINFSASYFSLDASGGVIEHATDGHPDAVSVLAVPGGQVPDDLVARYGLGPKLQAADPNAVRFDPAGNAIVIEGNAARAVHSLPATDPRRAPGLKAEAERRAARAVPPVVRVEPAQPVVATPAKPTPPNPPRSAA